MDTCDGKGKYRLLDTCECHGHGSDECRRHRQLRKLMLKLVFGLGVAVLVTAVATAAVAASIATLLYTQLQTNPSDPHYPGCHLGALLGSLRQSVALATGKSTINTSTDTNTDKAYVNSRRLVRVTVPRDSSSAPFLLHEILNRHGADVLSASRHSVLYVTRGNNTEREIKSMFPALHPQVINENLDAYLLIEKQKRQLQQATVDRSALFSEIGGDLDFAAASANKWLKNYHPFDDVVAWYRRLAAKHPDRVRMLPDIGKTHEGRPIIALSITNRTFVAHSMRDDEESTRPRFYIQAGIHAREWISVAVAQYLAHTLATDKENAVIQSLLKMGEFVIVPVVNPDGYAYSWDEDRLWRKNRSPVGNGGSRGVDLNRNFASNWGGGGSSAYPDSETYMGPSAESELETKAITAFFRTLPSVVVALDLHAYSQLILRPIGWQHEPSPHERQLAAVSETMAAIIHKVHHKKYIAEKSVDLYPTTGSADDWFYMQRKNYTRGLRALRKGARDGEYSLARTVRPYCLTIELRPGEEFFGPGFELDAREIIPTSEEVVPAILHLATTAAVDPLFD